MDALKLISDSSLKENAPVFNVGDTVRVNVRIKEGLRMRWAAGRQNSATA